MHTLVVSNGFPPGKELLKKEAEQADLIVGADGGGNILLKHGLKPDVVIGDMDSFERPEIIDFEIIHESGQETNDLEKALSLVLQRDAISCTVLGAFGQRMDHSLKNLSVMKKYDSAFQTLIYRDELLTACFVSKRFEAELPVGSIVSLFPLSGVVTGVTTKGLKYPLEGEMLENGTRDGTSNENTEPAFSIEIDSGDLIVFIEHESLGRG